LGYWRVCSWSLRKANWWLISAFTRVFDALISAFTRVFDALWGGVDRTRGLPLTRRLLNPLSFERGKRKIGAHTTESNLGPLAYKASALAN
jgi:hypothetical protein